jgi:hypothetical protein
MAMWTLRLENGQIETVQAAETPTAWVLTLNSPDRRTVTYHIPRPRPNETGADWAGQVAARTALLNRLDGLHPLIPERAGIAWARPSDQASWIPVHGCHVPQGTALCAVPVSLDLFWQTVPPLVELLRLAERRGLMLRRLAPGEIIIKNGRPEALNASAEWALKVPDLDHDPTRVAARLIHWFLCALRQTPGAPEPPSTLWAICSRGLEGGYARTGLFKLEQDLQTAADRQTAATQAPPNTCLLIDTEGIKAATGAYLHPWLTLEALWEPGRTLDPVIAAYASPAPGGLTAAWKEARITPTLIPHFGPKDVTDLVRRTVPKGQKVLLVAGRRDLTYTCSALQRAGYPCEVLGFHCEAGIPVADGMERLKAALYLAAGGALTESEGGMDDIA